MGVERNVEEGAIPHTTHTHLREYQRVLTYFHHQRQLLRSRCVINTPLQHAAPMSVRCNLNTVRLRCIVNELQVVGSQALQTALDDVVAIEIPDQPNNASPKRIHHQ